MTADEFGNSSSEAGVAPEERAGGLISALAQTADADTQTEIADRSGWRATLARTADASRQLCLDVGHRFASAGLVLLIAALAALFTHREYRLVLGGAFACANLALAAASLASWRHPHGEATRLLLFSALIVEPALILLSLSLGHLI